ncbi:MAG: hypothetical protein KC422_12455 [Trueperaceae bacterium]|nr:hypothetical protein [Trueperaceae bacterium]
MKSLSAEIVFLLHNGAVFKVLKLSSLVSVLLLLYLLLSVAQAADIGLSPPRLELSGMPGETITETIIILGDATTEQQIQIRKADWTLKPDGELVILPEGSSSESASSWIQPEVEELALVGDGGQEFRISVTIPEDTSLAGTYHSLLFFTVVPPPSEETGIAVVTTTEIGMAVYVTVKETEENASELLDFFQEDDRSVLLTILNEGNTLMRLGGRLELRNEAGETKYFIEVPDVPVLRESERDLKLVIPEEVESGFYVALAMVEDSRGNLLVGELPLEIP